MKKKLLLAVFGVAALTTLATGCDKKEEEQNNNNNNQQQEQKVEDKKLNCSIVEKEDKYTETIRYNFTFKGESLEKVVLSVSDKYSGDKYDEKDAKKAQDECKESNSKNKGVSCNVVTSGSLITGTYTFTMANLDENGKKMATEAGLDELTGKNYDDLKAYLEKATFECK